jgi:hypothetical protein
MLLDALDVANVRVDTPAASARRRPKAADAPAG